nr:MAG TPA: pre-mRNA splicing factor component [Caudoviricetes sp.]
MKVKVFSPSQAIRRGLPLPVYVSLDSLHQML